MKGIVPAAGKGERLEPLTLAMPKEMIRVGTKPVIEHVLENIKYCGVRDVLVIIGWRKGALIDYLGSGERVGMDICYKVQDEQKGLAHAVYLAKDWIGNDDFVVVYGDNYFKPGKVMAEVAKFHKEKKADATILLYPVDDPTRFGIVKLEDDNSISAMVEKPGLEEAKPYQKNGKYYIIAGLVILNSRIFDYIEKTKPGKKNEIQITDSIELMRKDGGKICGFVFDGLRYDIGTFDSLVKADKLEINGK